MKTRVALSFYIAVIMCFVMAGCAGKGKPSMVSEAAKAEAGAGARARADYLQRLAEVGCIGKKVKLDKSADDHKKRLWDKYGFFVSPEGYGKEKEIFESCPSVEAMDKYFEVFWSIRDSDQSTPENEYKNLIDGRIRDIENEIFAGDMDIAGTRFNFNGGLKGDLARVYLLRGRPSFKIKTHQGLIHLADLMAWAYFDMNQKPIFVFLFYNKGDGFRVFRNHSVVDSYEEIKATLREISRTFPITDEDFNEIYRELMNVDDEGIFRFALRAFSYYPDIKIDRVLAPPTPEAITAKALQPRIIGVPSIPESIKMIKNGFFTSMAGYLRLSKNPDGGYGMQLLIRPSDFDWEDKNGTFESNLDTIIIVTNNITRERKEFISGLGIKLSSAQYASAKDRYAPVNLNELKNYSVDSPNVSLSEFLKTLPAGDYEIKVRLLHQLTLKSLVLLGNITIP